MSIKKFVFIIIPNCKDIVFLESLYGNHLLGIKYSQLFKYCLEKILKFFVVLVEPSKAMILWYFLFIFIFPK